MERSVDASCPMTLPEVSIDCMPGLQDGPKSKRAAKWVGFGVGLALLAAIVGGEIAMHHKGDAKVVIGAKDEVYYYRRATRDDALALGQGLKRIGFFTDRGTSVL